MAKDFAYPTCLSFYGNTPSHKVSHYSLEKYSSYWAETKIRLPASQCIHIRFMYDIHHWAVTKYNV